MTLFIMYSDLLKNNFKEKFDIYVKLCYSIIVVKF
jgi:hypothetical protein